MLGTDTNPKIFRLGCQKEHPTSVIAKKSPEYYIRVIRSLALFDGAEHQSSMERNASVKSVSVGEISGPLQPRGKSDF